MKRLSFLLLFLLVFSTFALLLPINSQTQEAHAATPNWKVPYSCLNAKAVCVDISGPLTFFQGLPNSNITSHYVFLKTGQYYQTNSLGSNLSVSIITAKWGSLPFAVPLVINAINSNASAVWWTFNYNLLGNTASVTVYWKEKIQNGYVMQDGKIAISYSFSAPATLNQIFVNPLNAQVTYDSAKRQILFGRAGYDWSDSPSGTYNLSTNTLSWSVGTSGIIDPTTIGTSTSSGPVGQANQWNVWSVNGVEFAAYWDGLNGGWRCSSDGGVTWGSFNSIGTLLVSGVSLAIYVSGGTKITYARVASATSVKTAQADVTAGSCAISFGVENSIVPSPSANGFSVAVAYSGTNIWTAFSANSGVDVEVFKDTIASKDFTGLTGANYVGAIVTSTSVTVAWQSSSKLSFSDTTDGGTTWTPLATSTNTYTAGGWGITSISDVVYFGACNVGTVYFGKFTVGSTVSGETSEVTGLSNCGGTSISSDGSAKLVITYTISTSEIDYIASVNSGSVWRNPASVVTGETSITVTSYSVQPSLVSSKLDVLWVAGVGPTYNVRFVQYTPVFSVTQPITVTINQAAQTSFTYTVSACGVSPTSGTASSAGTQTSFTANPSCTLTLTVDADGANLRHRWRSTGTITVTVVTCASGTCTDPSITVDAQNAITGSYSGTVAAGGVPSVSSTRLGIANTATVLTTTPTTIWYDSGAAYTKTKPIADFPSANERYDENAANGTISGGATIAPVFYHQFFVTDPNSISFTCTQFGSTSASQTTNQFCDNAGTVTISTTYTNAWTSQPTVPIWIYDVTQANIGFQLLGDQAISSIVWNNVNAQAPFLTFTTASSSHVKGFIPAVDGFSFSKVYDNGVLNTGATFASNILDETGASPHEWDFTTGVISGGGGGGGGGGGRGGFCLPGYIMTSSGCMLQSQVNPPSPPASGGAAPTDMTGLYTVAIIGTVTLFIGIGAVSRSGKRGGWRLPDDSSPKRRKPSNSKPNRRQPGG